MPRWRGKRTWTGIGVSQCRPLLQRMLARGSILQDRQRYILNNEKAPPEPETGLAIPAGGGSEKSGV